MHERHKPPGSNSVVAKTDQNIACYLRRKREPITSSSVAVMSLHTTSCKLKTTTRLLPAHSISNQTKHLLYWFTSATKVCSSPLTQSCHGNAFASASQAFTIDASILPYTVLTFQNFSSLTHNRIYKMTPLAQRPTDEPILADTRNSMTRHQSCAVQSSTLHTSAHAHQNTREHGIMLPSRLSK